MHSEQIDHYIPHVTSKMTAGMMTKVYRDARETFHLDGPTAVVDDHIDKMVGLIYGAPFVGSTIPQIFRIANEEVGGWDTYRICDCLCQDAGLTEDGSTCPTCGDLAVMRAVGPLPTRSGKVVYLILNAEEDADLGFRLG